MKTKLVTGVVAVIVVLAAVAYGAQRYAQGRADLLVEAILARPPIAKATHGAVHYSLWRGRIGIDELTVETAPGAAHRLQAAHVEIDGIGPWALARQDPGDLRADAIELDEFSLRDDLGQRSIRRLVVMAPHLEPAGAVPAGTPEPIAFLARFSAKSMVAEGVRFMGSGVDSSADRWTADDIVKGRVGAFAAAKSQSRVTLPSDPAAEDGAPRRVLRIEAAETRLKDVDLAAAYAAVAAMKAGRPFALSYGEGSLSKLTIAEAGRGGALAVDSIVIDGVRLHGTGLTLPDRAAGEPAAPPTEEELKNLALAMAVDRLSIEGVTVTAPDGGSGHAAVLELKGLAMDIEDVSHRAPKIFVEHFRLGGVAAHAPNGVGASIGEITAAMSGTLDQPTGGDLEVNAVALPAGIAPIFGRLGYEKVSADMAARTTVDRTQGAIDGRLTLKAADAGALELTFRASNCPLDLSPADTAAMMARWSEAKLDRAQLHYEDASLADRLFRYAGALTGGDAAAARQQIIDLAMARRAAVQGMPTLERAADAIVAFLRQPQSLTIALAPAQPVRLGDLGAGKGDPEAVASLLNLAIR